MSKPWIAKVSSWPEGKRPELDWGDWIGNPGGEGTLEIEAEPGDIIRWGQKDKVDGSQSANEWAVASMEGDLNPTSFRKAKEQWEENQGGQDDDDESPF